ncbi:hypothetical protein BDU57DRAFT_557949 [Ampelomyces quisqualis]|uniref:AA9 family lytic polysaccharide monooxygenase n=1 Tax=Ampelomyces quisqualis TaxID=50730 RepID=A0A6A5QHV4_AMPQU|nr:hypothetical protein BDU57DRAFT_557949 [Ampelomyces quisqualis]
MRSFHFIVCYALVAFEHSHVDKIWAPNPSTTLGWVSLLTSCLFTRLMQGGSPLYPSNLNTAPIAAGKSRSIHKGPLTNYIDPCNGSATAELGWIYDRIEEVYWAADKQLEDDSNWNISISTGLKAGDYMLRIEIITWFWVELMRALYIGAEPGVVYRTLHESQQHKDYAIPGPPLWSHL